MNFKKYINIPYKYNSADFTGCDCYGLCILIFKEERGIELPSMLSVYSNIHKNPIRWYKDNIDYIGNSIKEEQKFYKVGSPYKIYDGLIFFNSKSNIANHIGLYIGNNQFIHTFISRPSEISKLDNYWKSKLYGAVRYV